MKLLYSLFILSLLASPLQAIQQNRFARKKSSLLNKSLSPYTVSNAVAIETSGNTRCYLYRENSSLTATTPSANGWSYRHNDNAFDPDAVPEADFIAIPGSEGNASLDFNLFFAEPKDPGFYAFRSGDKAVLFYIDGIADFTATPATAVVDGNKSAEFRLKATLHSETHLPQASPTDNTTLLDYKIIGHMDTTVHDNKRPRDIDSEGRFRAERNVLLAASTAGSREVEVGYFGKRRKLKLEALPPPEPFLVLLNANDSNNSFIADNEEPEVQNTPDLELMPLNIFALPQNASPLFYDLLNAPIEPGLPTKIVLTTSPQILAYSSLFKQPLREFVRHPNIPENLHSFEVTLTANNRDIVLNTLTTLYIEGIHASQEDENAILTIQIKRGEATVATGSWHIVVLHMRMNASMPCAFYPAPAGGQPVPRLKNPSVIPIIPGAQEMPTAELEPLTAWYELQSQCPGLLQRHSDALEWRIQYNGDNPVRSLDHGEITVNHPMRGATELKLYGLDRHSAMICVRLRGMQDDYIKYIAAVNPYINIPVCFQFFPSDWQTRLRAESYAARIPAILETMNLLGRQAAIRFVPVNSMEIQFPNFIPRFNIRLANLRIVQGDNLIPALINTTQEALLPLFSIGYPASCVYTLLDNNNNNRPWQGTVTAFSNMRENPPQPSYIRFNLLLPHNNYPANIQLHIPQMPDPQRRPNGIVFHNGTPGWISLGNKHGYIIHPNPASIADYQQTGPTRPGISYAMTFASIPRVVTFNFGSNFGNLAPLFPAAVYGGEETVNLSIIDISNRETFTRREGKKITFGTLHDQQLAVINCTADLPEQFLQQNTLQIARNFIAHTLISLGQLQRNLDNELDVYSTEDDEEDEDPITIMAALEEKSVLDIQDYLTFNPVVPYTDIEDQGPAYLTDIVTNYRNIGITNNFRIDHARFINIKKHPWLQNPGNP